MKTLAVSLLVELYNKQAVCMKCGFWLQWTVQITNAVRRTNVNDVVFIVNSASSMNDV